MKNESALIIELRPDTEIILVCRECGGREWLVIERRDTAGPICRCVNCDAEAF